MKLFKTLTLATAVAIMFTATSCEPKKTETDGTATDTTATTTPVDTTTKMEATGGVMVGGAMMMPSKDIVDNAAESKDHTMLVDLVKKAGLVETLKGGEFTVFAPTNDAFAKVDKKTLEGVAADKAKLTSVLTYHVVPGKMMAADLTDGKELITVQKGKLKVTNKDGKISISDENGQTVGVTIADVVSSNGVTFVVDGVLLPKM